MAKKALSVAAFDYGQLTKNDKGKLECLALEIYRHATNRTAEILELGRVLIEAQLILSNHKTGTFNAWVEKECGFTPRTAYNYMAAHEHFFNCETVSQYEPSALYVLAGNDRATKASLKLTANGERITKKRALLIVEAESNGHTPAKPNTSKPVDARIVAAGQAKARTVPDDDDQSPGGGPVLDSTHGGEADEPNPADFTITPNLGGLPPGRIEPEFVEADSSEACAACGGLEYIQGDGDEFDICRNCGHKYGDPVPAEPTDTQCSRCGGSGRVPITAKMPPTLAASPEFVNSWQDYQLFRIEKKSKLTTIGIGRIFKKLAKWGPERATAALEHTMFKGWAGVFEENQNGRNADDPRGNMATLEAYINGL